MIQIRIRDIQHYLYCPHRWGLLIIDCAWAENYYVVKGNILHKRVHDSANSYNKKDKKVITSLAIYDDELMLQGEIDCLECIPNKDGVTVDKSGEKYKLKIVEYKPTAPRNTLFHPEDALQLFAQKICVDSVFNTDCDAVIYYANSKKRVELPFSKEYGIYYKQLTETLRAMRDDMEQSRIPDISISQNCNGCSLKDICMPHKRKQSLIRKRTLALLEEA